MNGQEQKTPADGISPDGYIVDQDCFSSVRYRTMRADWNGCGWIAAYNLRHYLGHEVGWDEVRAEMDAMHTLCVPGPTLMRVMRGYLSRYVPGYRETSGREEALTAAEESEAGIFRYREGDTPHFICYLRQDDGQFRFFNVDDNIDDGVMSMQKFGREHFLRGNVIALTIPREKEESP
jgi:hypothetical protein